MQLDTDSSWKNESPCKEKLELLRMGNDPRLEGTFVSGEAVVTYRVSFMLCCDYFSGGHFHNFVEFVRVATVAGLRLVHFHFSFSPQLVVQLRV